VRENTLNKKANNISYLINVCLIERGFMRQRLRNLSHRFKENCPRTHKIIDKTVGMIGWTPVIMMVYGQILVLTYGYYKSACNKTDK